MFPEFLIGIFMKTKAHLVLPLKLTLRFDGRCGSSEVKNQPLCAVFVIFALLLFFQDAESFSGGELKFYEFMSVLLLFLPNALI